MGNQKLEANLILLDIQNFDVILGMDWLSFHHAIVDCLSKEMNFRRPRKPVVLFKGERKGLSGMYNFYYSCK